MTIKFILENEINVTIDSSTPGISFLEAQNPVNISSDKSDVNISSVENSVKITSVLVNIGQVSPTQQISITSPADSLSFFNNAIESVQINRDGTQGPPGPVGPSGESTLGGFGVDLTDPTPPEDSILIFKSNTWVDRPKEYLVDGGNF